MRMVSWRWPAREFCARRSNQFISCRPGNSSDSARPAWRDDLQIRRERAASIRSALGRSLAGSAVGDSVGFFFLRDFDHAFGDECRAMLVRENIALINRAGVEHRKNESRANSSSNRRCRFGGAGLFSFRFRGRAIRLPARCSRRKAIISASYFFLNPRKQHRRIEAARIS